MMIQRIGYFNNSNVNFGVKFRPAKKDDSCKSVPAPKVTTKNIAQITPDSVLTDNQIKTAHVFLNKQISNLQNIINGAQVDVDVIGLSTNIYSFKNEEYEVRVRDDGASSYIYFAVKKNNNVYKLELMANQINQSKDLKKDYEYLKYLLEINYDPIGNEYNE